MNKNITKKTEPNEIDFPVPPEDLRWRVVANRNEKDFLTSGVHSIRILDAYLNDHLGKHFSDFKSIFDFGCGCGRLLRHLPAISDASLNGCDIDAEAIAWCSENLHSANFFVGGEYPPIPSNEKSFELIYAISVFTHIDEDHQFKWLEELKRVSTPGGYLLLTFRDKNIVSAFPEGGIKKQVLAELEEKGISFVHNKGWKGVFPEWYGGTYHTFDYIRGNWGKYFDVIDLSAPRGAVSQCIALLRNS
jgi:SAM-dependent methyltransferase